MTVVRGVFLTRSAVFMLGSQNGVLLGLAVAHVNRPCPPVEVCLKIPVTDCLLFGGQGVVSVLLAKIRTLCGGFRLVLQGVKFLLWVGSLDSGSRNGFWRGNLFGFLFLGFGTAASRL